MTENFYRGSDGLEPDREHDPANNSETTLHGAPWKQLLEKSVKKNSSDVTSKYVQLATVRPNGKPSCRTIVFRGFLPGTNSLYFVTDLRSEKISEIAHNPAGEIAWYLPITREQYRISGNLLLVGPEDHPLSQQRQDAWKRMSDNARVGFAWPAPGSSPVAPPEHSTAATASADQPLDTFALLVMEPEAVDHLILKGVPQRRARYHLHRPAAAAAAAAAAGGSCASGAAGEGEAAVAGQAAGVGQWVCTPVNP